MIVGVLPGQHADSGRAAQRHRREAVRECHTTLRNELTSEGHGRELTGHHVVGQDDNDVGLSSLLHGEGFSGGAACRLGRLDQHRRNNGRNNGRNNVM
jgi:hypothetical protein